MKILHISKFYPPEPGGIESFVCDLAEAQVRQGHEVYVLAHQSEFNKPTCREQINGVKVRRIRTFGQAAYAPLTPEFPLHLRSSIRTFRPDLIHAHLPNISAFWMLFARKPCPLLLHWHADVVASPIDRKMGVLYNFYKPWELLLVKKADKVIATSGSYLNASRPLSGFLRKTRVIPLGINPGRLADSHAGSRPAASDKGFNVLSVGRFAYYKGFEYLVQAAEKLPDVQFVIVGDGPRYSEIKKLVCQKGLQDRVQLPGQVKAEQLRKLFLDCDLFCLPSLERTEAFGVVLLEAMSLGKPLVTTKIPGSGMSEVNVHGTTGLQVPPADADALASAIDDMRKDLSACRQMGEAARRRFETHFHISAVAEQIKSLYELY